MGSAPPFNSVVKVFLFCFSLLSAGISAAQSVSPAVDFFQKHQSAFEDNTTARLLWLDAKTIGEDQKPTILSHDTFTEVVFASSERAGVIRRNIAQECPPLRILAPNSRAAITAFCAFTNQQFTISESAATSASSPMQFTLPSPQPTDFATHLLAVATGLRAEKKEGRIHFDALPPDPLAVMPESELLKRLESKIDHYAQFPIPATPPPAEIAAVAKRRLTSAVPILKATAEDHRHPWGDEARVALNILGAPIPQRPLSEFAYFDAPIRPDMDSAEFAEPRAIALAVIDQAFLPFGIGMVFNVAQKNGDSFTFKGSISGAPMGIWSMTVYPEGRCAEAEYKVGPNAKALSFDLEKQGGQWLVLAITELD